MSEALEILRVKEFFETKTEDGLYDNEIGLLQNFKESMSEKISLKAANFYLFLKFHVNLQTVNLLMIIKNSLQNDLKSLHCLNTGVTA